MGNLVSASYWQSDAGIAGETSKPNKAGKWRQTKDGTGDEPVWTFNIETGPLP
jgi:hypothetical protein